jgi:hypothetical protein
MNGSTPRAFVSSPIVSEDGVLGMGFPREGPGDEHLKMPFEDDTR